jgi:hypothetical protein
VLSKRVPWTVAVLMMMLAPILAGCASAAAPRSAPQVARITASPIALRLRFSRPARGAVRLVAPPPRGQHQVVVATLSGIGAGHYTPNRWSPVRQWWGTGYELRRDGPHRLALVLQLASAVAAHAHLSPHGGRIGVSFGIYGALLPVGGEAAAWLASCGVGLPRGIARPGPRDPRLPSYYQTYKTVRGSVGPLLARHSGVTVLLPTSLGLQEPVASLHVQYGTGRGYCLALSGGIPAAADTAQAGVGASGAAYLATVQGWPASVPLATAAGPHGYLPFYPLTGTSRPLVITGPLHGRVWGTPMNGETIRWYQDGWTISEIVNADVSAEAPSVLARWVATTRLPAPHGLAIFTSGAPDAPSLATYVRHQVRYVVMANGGRALALAARLRRVPRFH